MASLVDWVYVCFGKLLGHLAGDERSARRFKLAGLAIVANILSKALGFLVLIYSTRVALTHLGPIRFGVWVTISSVATLLGFLDFGVSNALIGRVAALNGDKSDSDRLAQLVTGGVALLGLLGVVVGLVLSGLFAIAPLSIWFKGISRVVSDEARLTGYVFAALFGLSLAAQGVFKVYAGIQHGWIANLMSAAAWIASLFLVSLAPTIDAPMWFYLLVTYGLQQFGGALLLWGLYRRRLLEKPRRAVAAIRALKGDTLVREGRLFFIIQIAFAIGWGANQFILSALVGPEEAGIFGVLQRMFMIVQVALTILNLPLWAMYADAFANSEYRFIKGLLKRSLATTLLCSVAGVTILVLGGPLLVKVVAAGRVDIPYSAIALMALWTVIEACGISFSMYLNGVGRIRPQAVSGTLHTIVGLPLKVFAVHFYGLNGLLVAMIASYVVLAAVPLLTIFRSECFDGIITNNMSLAEGKG